MNSLYGSPCHTCGGTRFHNEAETTIHFSSDVLSKTLKAIYEGFNVRDEIQRDAWEETLRLFNEATVEGLSQSRVPAGNEELFYEQLRTNNEVFSAFRTHRLQNDLAAQLIDGKGKLKPFDKWMQDVEGITDHYVKRWLQTEYDTVILRAHQAADWRQFEAEADVFPNVRWMPTTSIDPDIYHKQYWEAKLTLPVGHPFWKRHRPGDRWNCKCGLEQTDAPATDTVIADFEPIPEVPGLDNNPAGDGKLFSDSHPYYTEAYPGAKEAVEKALRSGERAAGYATRLKEIKVKAAVLKQKILYAGTFEKGIHVTGRGIKEWLNQPHRHYAYKNEMLLRIGEVLKDARYVGFGKDKHDPTARAHLFEVDIMGDKSWIIVRELKDGTVSLHSISDSENILNLLKEKTEL